MSEISFGYREADEPRSTFPTATSDFGGGLPRKGLYLGALIASIDAIVVVLTCTVAAWLAMSAGLIDSSLSPILTAIFFALSSVCIFAVTGVYREKIGEVEEIKGVVTGSFLTGMLAVIVIVGTQEPFTVATSLLIACLTLVFSIGVGFLLCLARVWTRSLGFVKRRLAQPVVVFGERFDQFELATPLFGDLELPLEVVAHRHGDELTGKAPKEIVEEAQIAVRASGLDSEEVLYVLAPACPESQEMSGLATALATAGLTYECQSPMGDAAGRDASAACAGVLPCQTSRPETQRGLEAQKLSKSILDVAGAFVLIVVLAPLLALIALALSTEKGGIFFTQMRVGKDRKRFKCLKFRTMRPDAEELLTKILAEDPELAAYWRKHQKLPRDPRVTVVGRFLRATSLDELPQLFNVLLGDMSLVGPRPIVAPEVPGYDGDQAYYSSASFAAYAQRKPGITGLWQVSGRDQTTHSERVRLDVWYCENWSVWLDLLILAKTSCVLANKVGR